MQPVSSPPRPSDTATDCRPAEPPTPQKKPIPSHFSMLIARWARRAQPEEQGKHGTRSPDPATLEASLIERAAQADRERSARRRRTAREADAGSTSTPPPAFQLPNPALLPPSLPDATHVAHARERAEAAAMVERLLSSIRVGRVGGGHAVRLRLREGSDGSAIEIQLEERGGALSATVRSPPAGRHAAERLAQAIELELHRRGLRTGPVRTDIDT